MTVTLVVFPIAAACEDDRGLETALWPELLDEVPLPMGLRIIYTLGLAICCD